MEKTRKPLANFLDEYDDSLTAQQNVVEQFGEYISIDNIAVVVEDTVTNIEV